MAVATPAYEGLFRAVEAAGGVAESVPVWGPGASALDLARMFEFDMTRYGAVVEEMHHNPTGLTARATDLAALADRCAEAGTTLVVDQVSLGTLDPSAPSAMQRPRPSSAVVQVGDVGESLGLGGAPRGVVRRAPTRGPGPHRRATRRHKSGQLGAEPTPGRHRPGEPVGLISYPHGSHKPRSLVLPRGRVGTSGRMGPNHHQARGVSALPLPGSFTRVRRPG